MFKNYLTTAYRHLLRYKLDSLLNISGLVIGLTAALLITLFIRHEISYDGFWKDSQRLYRIQTRWVMQGRDDINIVNSPGPLKAAFENYFPNEIQAAARLNFRTPVVYVDSESYADPVSFADPEILDIFDFEIVAGDARAALRGNASIILNEMLARKYFGDADAIGKTLTLDNGYLKRDYQVLAVMRDLPLNTHLDIQALIRIDESDYVDNSGKWMFSSWNSASNHTYFKLHEGNAIEDLNKRIDDFTDASLTVSKGKPSDVNKFNTIAVTDIHLRSEEAGNMKPGGDSDIVYAFGVIALLIVIVATINYINLTTARAGQRVREISIRKVMGARRGQLIFQQLGESTLFVGLALLLTVLLVELALPFLNNMLQLGLVLELGDPLILIGLLSTLLVIGGLSGIYPALILSSSRPSDNLRATTSSSTKGAVRTRNILVVFQTAVTVGLVVATTVVYAQLTYFRLLDRGFEPDQLLVVQGVSRSGISDQQEAFRQLVEGLPGVTTAALSYEAPTKYSENNTRVRIPGESEEKSYPLGSTSVDLHYLQALQVPLLAGRFYQAEMALDQSPQRDALIASGLVQGNIVINDRAVDALGLGTPEQALGRTIETRYEFDNGVMAKAHLTVIGVIGNANLHSAKKTFRPEVYELDSNYNHLLVRYTGTSSEVLSGIQDIWSEMTPSEPFEYFYVDQALEEEFQSEASQANIFLSFALLAMVIGCLGLYGLAAFVTECRRREIGIRKILGARVRDIITLLFGQFSWLVLAANLMAWPVAYLLMSDWLLQYPFRIGNGWIVVICFLAGLLASVVVVMTVGTQAWSVARANPIKAIRHE
jgi:putative ABC transport system permease protein